jgi:hypothetical protein
MKSNLFLIGGIGVLAYFLLSSQTPATSSGSSGGGFSLPSLGGADAVLGGGGGLGGETKKESSLSLSPPVTNLSISFPEPTITQSVVSSGGGSSRLPKAKDVIPSKQLFNKTVNLGGWF